MREFQPFLLGGLTGRIPGPIKCPRCESANTKFCYYNNYNMSQPRHYCKSCRRYWTKGGVLRNVPVGGGCRKKSKRSKPDKDKINRMMNESGSSSSNSNPNPVQKEREVGGLAGLQWGGPGLDPTAALLDLSVDPGLYWGDVDPITFYVPDGNN